LALALGPLVGAELRLPLVVTEVEPFTEDHLVWGPVAWEDVLYVGDEANTLYALDTRTGRVLWQETRPRLHELAIRDGCLYYGAEAVEAFDPLERRVCWTWRPSGEDGVHFGFDELGQVIVARAHGLTALDRKGQVRWEARTGSMASPPVGAGSLVFVTLPVEEALQLRAYDREGGQLRWTKDLGFGSPWPPAVDGNRVYSAADDILRAHDAATGEEQWQIRLPAPADGSPLLRDETVFVILRDGLVCAIREGQLLWTFSALGLSLSESLSLVGGYVFVRGDRLFALEAETGRLAWASPPGQFSGPPAVAGGALYLLRWGREPSRPTRLVALRPAVGEAVVAENRRTAEVRQRLDLAAQAEALLPAGNRVTAVEPGDLDGDGQTEVTMLVRAEEFQHQVTVFTWPGQHLRAPVSQGTEAAMAARLELRDLTGDGRPEVLVEGGTGAHSRVFEAFRYAGGKIQRLLQAFDSAPSAVELKDLNGDGRLEVLNPTGDRYVFSYAEGICDFVVEIYEWDGTQFRNETFRDLPAGFQPAEAKQLNDGALRLAKANLWDEAYARLTRALQLSNDPRLRWNLDSVQRHLELFREQVQRVAGSEGLEPQERALKLGVAEVLAGHYDRALDAWAKLDPASAALKNAPWSGDTLKEKSEAVLSLFGNHAGAHFVRGLAFFSEGKPGPAAAAFRRALELAPEREFIAAWVKAAGVKGNEGE